MAKLIYGVIFLIAFAAVSGAMIYLNNSYNNIFKFDFSAPSAQVKTAVQNATKNENAGKSKGKQMQSKSKIDTHKKIENLHAENLIQDKDSVYDSLLDEIEKLKHENNKLKKVEKQLEVKESKIQEIKEQNLVKADSAYTKWKKEMVKLYEKMDSRAAAKLLTTINENQARDILQIMKKKKAAEIITQLNPETASKLVRFE